MTVPPLAILRPDGEFLSLLERGDRTSWSYSQACRGWPGLKPHLAIVFALPAADGSERLWGLAVVRPAHASDRDRKVVVSLPGKFDKPVEARWLWHDREAIDERLRTKLPTSGPIAYGAADVYANLGRHSADLARQLDDYALRLDDDGGRGDMELRRRDERDALLLFAKIAGIAQTSFTAAHPWFAGDADPSYLCGMRDSAPEANLLMEPEPFIVRAGFDGRYESVVRILASDKRVGPGSYRLEATAVWPRWAAEQTALDAYYYHPASGALIVMPYLHHDGRGLPRFPGYPRDMNDEWHRFERLDKLGDYEGFCTGPLYFRVLADAVPFAAAVGRTDAGAIFPYSQVADAVERRETLPAYGIPLYGEPRHLVPTDFSRLVRDGWLGCLGVPRRDVLAAMEESLEAGASVLLVVDFSSRPRGNGDGLGIPHRQHAAIEEFMNELMWEEG